MVEKVKGDYSALFAIISQIMNRILSILMIGYSMKRYGIKNVKFISET